MVSYLKPALILFLLMTLLTGVFYPLAVTGIAQSLFPLQANGSLILDKDGKVIGSYLIGQSFKNPAYFWSRPSATMPYPYNASASSGSNLGPSNPALLLKIKARTEALKQAGTDTSTPIPVDLATASASGLDPHLSPAAAAYQVKRIAAKRGMPESEVQKLVDSYTEKRQWQVFGEPRVNVLLLNQGLDRISAKQQ